MMKTMKNMWFPMALALLLTLAMATLAYAQTPLNNRIFWSASESYTDGTPIEAGDLTSYTLSCGTQSGQYNLTMVVPGDTTEASRATLMENMGLLMGPEYHCAVQATTANQLTSAYSNEVHLFLPDHRVPSAPQLATE